MRFRPDELMARLDAAGIPAARLNTVHEVVAHPQLAARDRWRQVDTPAGPIRAVLPPIIFAGMEARMDAVPDLGEHTDAVLTELGRSEDQISGLRARGVI